jgi:ATPase subunit of ABC transporter with duplicated ATPase domains
MDLRYNCVSHTFQQDAVSVKGLDLAVGSKQLLTNTDLAIPWGERIALLGRNGSGKTTLFRLLSSLLTKSPARPWSIYEVVQELPPSDQTPVQVVLGSHLERGALWERQAALETIDEMTGAELEEYTHIGEQLAAMSADSDPPRARRILHGLGFSATEMDAPLRSFSGGWRARVALAQGLFMEPDLLLLDEPTNHLDINGVIWLSHFLQTWKKALVVISHNVGFVRAVGTTIWNLERGTVATYRCRYDRFLRQKAEEMTKREKDWAALEKTLGALKKKGTPAARKEADQLAAKRAAEGVCRPEKRYAPKFFFLGADETTIATPLIECADATLGYSRTAPPILGGVTFALYQKSRIALVGSNGSGKSTLIRFLAGELPALNDTAVQRRNGLRVCVFDQHFYHTLPEDMTPLEYVRARIPCKEDGSALFEADSVRKVLGASGLDGAAHTRHIGTLSGGQKARVYFAGIAVQDPDILLMDEPTNHLDIETIEGLSDGLKEFTGAAIIVSHDLDFLEEVATEVWHTAGGSLLRRGEGTDWLDQYVEGVLEELR